MRIVRGRLGGRTFESPKGHVTHPMSEKVRGALFNIIGDISELTILDAFSGSGALSIESVSLGASAVTAIEVNPSSVDSIKQNVRNLGIQNKIKIIRANARSWSDKNPEIQFDVVLCDPPYDRVQESLLIKLAAHTRLGGLLVYSLPPLVSFELPPAYQLLSNKSYGDATLVFYRRKA